MTGEVRLDDGGDRIGNYRVWHLRVDDDEFEPLLDVVNVVEWTVMSLNLCWTLSTWSSGR